jgi:hypothetical protein
VPVTRNNVFLCCRNLFNQTLPEIYFIVSGIDFDEKSSFSGFFCFLAEEND